MDWSDWSWNSPRGDGYDWCLLQNLSNTPLHNVAALPTLSALALSMAVWQNLEKPLSSGSGRHGLFGLLQWLICMVQITCIYQWRDFILTTCNNNAKSNQHTTPLSCSIILPWFYYSQTFWTWSPWTNCKTYSQQMIYHGRKVSTIFIMPSHEQKLKTIGHKD